MIPVTEEAKKIFSYIQEIVRDLQFILYFNVFGIIPDDSCILKWYSDAMSIQMITMTVFFNAR